MTKYAYTNPRAKQGRYRVEPVVFAVPKDETADGRYHEVVWAKDGNLNASYRRGDVKQFRTWVNARKFANQKAKELGARAVFGREFLRAKPRTTKSKR